MAKRNKKHDSTKETTPAQTAELVSLGVTDWAKSFIASLSTTLSASERMALDGQLHSLTIATTRAPTPLPDPTKPTIVRNVDALGALAAKISAAPDVAIDLETSSTNPFEGEIVGIGFAVQDGTFYLPIHHRLEDGSLRPSQLTLAEVLDAIDLSKKLLIAHNAKFELRWLRRHGRVQCCFTWDTLLAARLLHSNLKADLESVACRMLDVPTWSLTTGEMNTIQFMPIERVANYCAKDCWYTLEIFRRQHACLA